MLRSFLRSGLLAGAALAAVQPALADVRAGVEAWSRGDYAAAVREWTGPAEKGDSDAQFNLGQAYKLGRGVPQDLPKAEDLFARAAAKGHIQASDNYGLLLFQRGERTRAMPYIMAASDRGDARARYLLGLAYFNGENVPKDWVRAYALVSLAQQAGLPQAVPALAQMDQHIPLDQRRQSVKLAAALAAEADATRARQLAAIDLGAAAPTAGSPRPTSMGAPSFAAGSRVPTVPAARSDGSAGAGADYTSPKPAGPRIPAVADIMETEAPATPRAAPPRPPAGRPGGATLLPVKPASAQPRPAPAPVPPLPSRPSAIAAAGATPTAAPTAAKGPWRIQLGAFGVAGNADALWNRLKHRPELAGHGKLLVPAGKLTKLQAGGFASEADARAACARLSAAGVTCLATRN